MKTTYEMVIKHRRNTDRWETVLNNKIVARPTEHALREAVVRYVADRHPDQEARLRNIWIITVQDDPIQDLAAPVVPDSVNKG